MTSTFNHKGSIKILFTFLGGLVVILLLYTGILPVFFGSFFNNLGYVGLSRLISADPMIVKDDPTELESTEQWFLKSSSFGTTLSTSYGLGWVYKISGETVKSVEVISNGFSEDSDSTLSRLLLGDVYFIAGDRENAIKEWEKASVESVLFYRGRSFEDEKDWVNAFVWYENAADVNPNKVSPYYRMGIVLRRIGDYQQAIVALQKAASIAPDDPYTHHQLGLNYMSLGKRSQAISEFKIVLVSLPHDYWTLLFLAGLSLDQGQLSDAERYATEANELSRFPRASYILGEISYLSLEYVKAIGYFEQSLILSSSWEGNPPLSKSELIQYHQRLAESYCATGQTENADAIALKILEIDPGNDFALQLSKGCQ